MKTLRKAKNTLKNQIPHKYKEAFMKLFECEEKDFEMQPCWEGGPMLANYKDETYQIDSAADINNHCRESLTDEHMAGLVPLDFWVDIAEDVHRQTNFLAHFFEALDEEEYAKVNLALTASIIASNPDTAFWESIYSMDHTGEIYPKAIIAAAKTYDLDCLVDELSELFILHGDDQLNEFQEGIFESVCLNEDSDNKEHFYIYSVDPINGRLDYHSNNYFNNP